MRALLISCLILLAAGAAFLCRGDDTAPPPAAPPTAQAPAPEPATPVAPVAVPDEQPAIAAAPAVREAAATRAADANEAPALADDATWLELTVVDGVTKEPASGVDVFWWNQQQWQIVAKLPPRERDELYRDQDALARRFGWHARTDDAGKVRVAHGKDDGAMVVARDERRYGQGWFGAREASPDERTLELFFDRTLLVHVADATGEHADGVPVEVAPHDPDSGAPPNFWRNHQQFTDAGGIARFVHVQQIARWQWGPQRGKNAVGLAVAVTTPGLEFSPTMLDPEALPEQPVELRLPGTGHLALRLWFDRRPIPKLTQIGIEVQRAETTRRELRPSSALYRPVGDDGFARFRHVPLGATFVTKFEGAGVDVDVPVVGPLVAGQTVTTTIDLADQACALSGRLSGPDGKALAGKSVGIDYDFGRRSGSGTIETDADGRFLWIAGRFRDEEPPKLERLVFQLQAKDAAPLRCTATPGPLTAGRNELGELRMAVDTLLVGGRFVFDGGEPRHVMWNVERFTESTRPGREGRWAHVEGVQQTQHDDQRFEAHGPIEPGRYRVNVHAWNHLPVEPVEFAPGTKDLEIRIACGNRLDASCILPDGVEPQRLRLVLQPAVAPPPPKDGGRGPFGFDGFGPSGDRLRAQPVGGKGDRQRYRWPAIDAGSYTLVVETVRGGPSVLTIPDVVVPAPEGGDPRLHDIDLRDVLQALEVTLRFPDGEQRPRATLFPLPQPDDGTWNGHGVFGRKATLAMPKGPVDLLVAAEGCRPVTLRGVADAVELTMERWPTLELQLVGTGALPEDVELVAGVRAARERTRRRYGSDFGGGSLDRLLVPPNDLVVAANGVVTITLADGVQQLDVQVRVGRSSKPLEQVAPRDVVAGSPVTVQLSADEIRRLADELRAKEPKK